MKAVVATKMTSPLAEPISGAISGSHHTSDACGVCSAWDHVSLPARIPSELAAGHSSRALNSSLGRRGPSNADAPLPPSQPVVPLSQPVPLPPSQPGGGPYMEAIVRAQLMRSRPQQLIELFRVEAPSPFPCPLDQSIATSYEGGV